jgi:hypothetical protein
MDSRLSNGVPEQSPKAEIERIVGFTGTCILAPVRVLVRTSPTLPAFSGVVVADSN